MRYLLYPDAVAKAAPKKLMCQQVQRQALAGSKNKMAGAAFPTHCTPGSGSDSNPAPAVHDKKQVWGQQCSSSCGCVVRFEAQLSNDGKGTLEYISYYAKKVVTVPQKARNNTGIYPQLQVQFTAKGRPMFEPCNCPTLHLLSHSTIRFMMQQKTLPKFQSTVEFQKPRSSPAFCRSVLQAQGLPSTDTHCFDVVEEAVTALCKGHMPTPRQPGQMLPATKCYGSQPLEHEQHPQTQIQQFVDDEDDDNNNNNYLSFVTSFGYSWKDRNDVPETWLAVILDALGILPVSTRSDKAALFRDKKEEEEENGILAITKKTATRRLSLQTNHVHDWVSYVDEIQELEKQQVQQEQTTASSATA